MTDDGRLVIRPLGRPGDLGWVVASHGEVYADEFGWDPTFEALVARIVADYANDHDDARESAWIAELDGERVGCVFLVSGGEDLATGSRWSTRRSTTASGTTWSARTGPGT